MSYYTCDHPHDGFERCGQFVTGMNMKTAKKYNGEYNEGGGIHGRGMAGYGSFREEEAVPLYALCL